MNPLLRGILGFKCWLSTSSPTTPNTLIVDYAILPTYSISNWITKPSVKFSAQLLSCHLWASCTTSNGVDNNVQPKWLMSCSCKTSSFRRKFAVCFFHNNRRMLQTAGLIETANTIFSCSSSPLLVSCMNWKVIKLIVVKVFQFKYYIENC